jgi:hypothetical protein
MSSTTGFLTIPLDAAQVPRTLRGLGDVTALFDPETGLGGDSSNGVVFAMIGRVAADYGLAHLGHLAAPLATLEPAQLPAAIADLERILERWREDPAEPLRIAGSDYPPATEIPALLAQPASLWPEHEDWDDVPFLIAVLKGHLRVLREAREKGQWVVHAKS